VVIDSWRSYLQIGDFVMHSDEKNLTHLAKLCQHTQAYKILAKLTELDLLHQIGGRVTELQTRFHDVLKVANKLS
jgi:hypothetical protein